LENNSEIILKEEFLNLNFDQLVNLISKDSLAVSSEKIIYKSILKWINYESIKRKHFFDQLMNNVRFCLMDSKELVELAQESLIKENSATHDLILKSLQYKLCIPLKSDKLNLNIRPRIPLGLPKVMMLFGGQVPKATDQVEAYDFRLQKWFIKKEMPVKRCRAGCIYHEGLVYLIGGFNGTSRIRSVDIYNPAHDEWTNGADMLSRRGTLGVGLVKIKI
jgi:kelch-like protein 2/3